MHQDMGLVPQYVNNCEQLKTDQVKYERHTRTIVLGDRPWGGFELSLKEQVITQGKESAGKEDVREAGSGRQPQGWLCLSGVIPVLTHIPVFI